MRRVLFVCSQNRLRSPTAEAVFADVTGVETASAGLNHDAEQPLTPELVAWADIVFVMEPAHLRRLRARFGRHLRAARVVCLEIPDEYDYMEPELVDLLRRKVGFYLGRAA